MSIPAAPACRARRRLVVVTALICAVAAAAVVSASVGQFPIPVGRVAQLLAAGPPGPTGAGQGAVLWNIRLPRIAEGLIVGVALGAAGALMQAVFSNPLAEPSVLGVTSGAGVGAAAAIVCGAGTGVGAAAGSAAGLVTVPAAAFGTATLTTVIAYQLARMGGEVKVINLILTGIAINAVCGAMIAALIFVAPTTSREQIIFWQMGSFNGARWSHVALIAPVIIACVIAAVALGGVLDVIALGDRAASHVGVNVPAVRLAAIAAATLLTAAAVAFAGLIGFVGLIVPHALRLIIGPSHRVLIPASGLAGALLLSIADIGARTLIPFADLPIGIFTAVIGGPVFFILLRTMMVAAHRAGALQ